MYKNLQEPLASEVGYQPRKKKKKKKKTRYWGCFSGLDNTRAH